MDPLSLKSYRKLTKVLLELKSKHLSLQVPGVYHHILSTPVYSISWRIMANQYNTLTIIPLLQLYTVCGVSTTKIWFWYCCIWAFCLSTLFVMVWSIAIKRVRLMDFFCYAIVDLKDSFLTHQIPEMHTLAISFFWQQFKYWPL